MESRKFETCSNLRRGLANSDDHEDNDCENGNSIDEKNVSNNSTCRKHREKETEELISGRLNSNVESGKTMASTLSNTRTHNRTMDEPYSVASTVSLSSDPFSSKLNFNYNGVTSNSDNENYRERMNSNYNTCNILANGLRTNSTYTDNYEIVDEKKDNLNYQACRIPTPSTDIEKILSQVISGHILRTNCNKKMKKPNQNGDDNKINDDSNDNDSNTKHSDEYVKGEELRQLIMQALDVNKINYDTVTVKTKVNSCWEVRIEYLMKNLFNGFIGTILHVPKKCKYDNNWHEKHRVLSLVKQSKDLVNKNEATDLCIFCLETPRIYPRYGKHMCKACAQFKCEDKYCGAYLVFKWCFN